MKNNELNWHQIDKKVERFKKLIIYAFLQKDLLKLRSLCRILKASRSFKLYINQRFRNQKSADDVIQNWLNLAEFKHLFKKLRSASFEILINKINYKKFNKISEYNKIYKIKRWAKRKHANKSWTWIKQKYQFNQLFKPKINHREAV